MKNKAFATKNTIASHSLRVFAGSIFAFLAVPSSRADLVAYWNFDDNTGNTLMDFSANKNDGTRAGTALPTWTNNGGNAGTGDHALFFNTNNTSYVSVPASTSLGSITNKFTIGAWLYETANTNYGHIMVSSNNGSNRNWLWQTESSGGGDQAYIWSSTVSAWQKPLSYTNTNNLWQHYTFTYDGTLGSNQLKSYRNGTFLNQYSVSGSPNFPSFSGGALYLGGWLANASGFKGYLDDMVIFNSVENPATIHDGTNSALKGYWTAGGTGPTYNWNLDANWGGARPSDRRALDFDTSNALTTNNNDFAANSKFAGMNFRSTAGAFTLSGNTVNLTGNVTNSSTATQTIGLNGLVLDGGTRTFDTASGDIIVNSNISQTNGTNGLTKIGNGVLTLAGTNNTYTGATLVSAGILRVSGTISGSAVTVQSGGTLGTSSGLTGGTVGAVTVQNNGTLAPGASTGLMTVAGNLTINSGGIFAAEINATGAAGTNYDQVTVAVPAGDGTVNIAGSTLTLSGSYLTTPSVTNDKFFILLNDGSDAITGTFANATLGEDSNYHVFAANGQDYLISYQADFGSLSFTGGNDIALMAVPEPGAAVSLLGGLGLLLGMRRRRA